MNKEDYKIAYENVMLANKMLEQEIERLKENNQAMQEEMARTWKKLDEKENIIKEVREYITYWHYRNDFRINSFTTGVKEELLKILDKENK